jgi:transcription antitermination factor NusG
MSQSQKKNLSTSLSRALKPKDKLKASNHKSAPPPPKVNQWITIQLSPIGERERDLSLIIKSVHQILRIPVEVFIPAISQKVRDESETMFFMDGYVFVEYKPDIQYLKLQDTNYFASVLCQTILVNGKRQQKYSLVQDKDLDSMRDGMQKLKIAKYSVGDLVRIIKGDYRNLLGQVSIVYEGGQRVQVTVTAAGHHLRSKRLLIDFPVTYLVKVNND